MSGPAFSHEKIHRIVENTDIDKCRSFHWVINELHNLIYRMFNNRK